MNTLSHSDDEYSLVLDKIAAGNRMVLVSGAGISTAAGLPDFRSAAGLYSTSGHSGGLSGNDTRMALDVVNQRQPEGLEKSNRVLQGLFSKMAQAKPTETHWLINEIYTLGRLERYYTQNIDGLEEQLSVPLVNRVAGRSWADGKVVQLHGSIRWLRCRKCIWREEVTEESANALWSKNEPIVCRECPKELSVSRIGRPLTLGTLKTDVLFYGEPHCFAEEVAESFQADISAQPDVLLVMGTSLTTTGSNSLVESIRKVAKAVHRTPSGLTVYINNQPPPSVGANIFDYHLSVDLEQWAKALLLKLESLYGVTTYKQPSAPIKTPQPSNSIKPCVSQRGDFKYRTSVERWYIILYLASCEESAQHLRIELLDYLSYSGKKFSLWCLLWEDVASLGVSQFGNENVVVELFLVLSNIQGCQPKFLESARWPPSRDFFKQLLSDLMPEVAVASESSRVMIMLDKRYYDLEPLPLHRLNFYVQWKKVFKLCILWEPVEPRNEDQEQTALSTLAEYATSEALGKVALEELENCWAKPLTRLSHFYDLTVIQRNERPLVLRSAQPEGRPFGRELRSLPCGCINRRGWVQGRYDRSVWDAICCECHKPVKRSRPDDTILRGDHGHWHARITQFSPSE